MKALKYKLAAAKAAHTALKSPAQMPDAKTYARAHAFIVAQGAALKDDGFNPQRRIHAPVIVAHDAVLAYRVEKSALAQAIADVQLELYAAQTASDLE